MDRPVFSFVLFFLLTLTASAQGVGVLTLRDGPLRVIRGTMVMQATEGMQLRTGDILETSDKGIAQLEFPAGAVAALGLSSRLLIVNHAVGGGAPVAVDLLLLTGWLKGETTASHGAFRYSSPQLAATTTTGTVLLHSSAGSSEVFFESGTGTTSPVTAEGNLGSPAAAKPGQFFARRGGKNVAVASRPDAVFIGDMPPPFRDTLPSRLDRFKGKNIEPKPDHQVAYADVDSWLNAATSWRRGFVERFKPRVRDAKFRSSLEAHLAEHPEWDPVLHPEKYQDQLKPASTEAPSKR